MVGDQTHYGDKIFIETGRHAVPQSPHPSPTEVLVKLIDTISTTPAPRIEGVPVPLVLPVPPTLTKAEDGCQGSPDGSATSPP
jgi:hypothetical protein